MLNIKINGVDCQVEPDTTILEAARANSFEIPTLCMDERVETYGACGLCLVEVEGLPKLLRACASKVSDGMSIYTMSPKVIRARRFALDMLLSDHVGDCVAPCSHACPANTDCQAYVGLIANGEYKESLKVIKKKIPLPACIGRICPHPCEQNCRRGLVDAPISIAALKSFAADYDLRSSNTYKPDLLPPTGKKVAVVGGGPGGLSAAYYLTIGGHSVTVFDQMPKMGGMLRYGIPQYRLADEVIDREIALIEDLGVKLINNSKLGEDITLKGLRADFDAVVLAVGAWTSGKMRVKGEDMPGVLGGIDFLRDTALGNAPEIGQRVAICGGGNTAMDACRTAVRLGAKEVYVVYRRTRDEMPAEKLEICEAEEEGVVFKFLNNPDEILGENGRVSGMRLQVMQLGEPDESGRRSPVPVEGKFEELKLDTVIMAIGQKLNSVGLDGVELNKRGNISADESTYLTNLDGVFAIGDSTNKGASIAIAAIGEAQRASNVICSYLDGEIKGYEKRYYVEKTVTAEDLKDKEKLPRHDVHLVSPEIRRTNFEPVADVLSEEDAVAEGRRCLECGCLDYHNCKLIKYAREYSADPSVYSGNKIIHGKDYSHKFIIRDMDKCVLCGLCVRICAERMGIGAIGLVGRGFGTVVSPEFRIGLDESRCTSCGQCVTVCPTGALMERVPFKKDIPLEENHVDTVCNGCAVGCALRMYYIGSTPTRAMPLGSDEIVCPYGRFGFGSANSPERVTSAAIKGNQVSEQDAYTAIDDALKNAGADKSAFVLSQSMTNEQFETALEFARKYNCDIFGVHDSLEIVDDRDKFNVLFGDNYSLGANAFSFKKNSIPDLTADSLKDKSAVVCFGGCNPEVEPGTFKAVESVLPVECDVLLPLTPSAFVNGTLTAPDGSKRMMKSILQ